MSSIRNACALSLIRFSAALVSVAARLAVRPLPERPRVVVSTMTDEHVAQMRRAAMLAAALRGLT